MATLDQLAAEQRAIIELVVQRGRSYDDLADMLAMPQQRVRQLAREALIELAPVSAKRVEADRRGQLADYVLGQQSTAEEVATQTHLRRSEAGRAWTSSLVDSLAGLYPGEPPEIPEGEVEPPPRRERERRPRERERPREHGPLRERGERAERRPLRDRPRRAERPFRREPRPRREPRRRPALSPEAQIAVRRRRLVGIVGAVLLVGGIVAGILIIAGGNDSDKKAKAAPAQFRVVGELLLQPLSGVSDTNQGIAIVGSRGSRPELVVQAKLTPTKQRQAYGVWLYNSRTDALALGAQVTDQAGNYVGRGALPADYRKYRYIDISTQVIPDPECARNPTCLREVQAHSGKSVLRGAIADMRGPNQAVPGGQGAPPTTTTPTP